MDYARQFVPPQQGGEGGRPDQALGPVGLGPAARVGARDRARAAAAALPERRRQGRHRRQPGEAGAEVQGEVSCLKTDLFINGEFVPAASGKRFVDGQPGHRRDDRRGRGGGAGRPRPGRRRRAPGVRVGALGGHEAPPARPDPDAGRGPAAVAGRRVRQGRDAATTASRSSRPPRSTCRRPPSAWRTSASTPTSSTATRFRAARTLSS